VEAVISGQAGIIALVRGDGARLYTYGDETSYQTVPIDTVSAVFRGTTDVKTVEVRDPAVARAELGKLWAEDRALRLTLIVLDRLTDNQEREETAECLEEFLSDARIIESLEYSLYAAPLPANAIGGFSGKRSPTVETFLGKLFRAQADIRRYSESFDNLPAELFGGATERLRFKEEAVRSGAFRSLVGAALAGSDRNLAILDCYKMLARLPNSRSVIGEWTKDFARNAGARAPLEPDEIDSDDSSLGPRSSRAEFENVLRQQNIIVQKLQSGQTELARRYASDLISQQIGSGGSHFAAKSLCRLAQEAKRFGAHTLQLEWAEHAASIAPEDPIAHGHAADALVYFMRLDEALKALDAVDRFGDRIFADTRRANVLRLQNRFPEALEAFDSIIINHPNSAEIPFAMRGAAETLRETWEFDKALGRYEAAAVLFPDDASVGAGRAALLCQLGRLSDALGAYDLVIQRSGHVVARNGRASVLAQMGRLPEAIDAYGEIIRLYPDDPVAYSGRASTLRQMGKLVESLDAYQNTKTQFPYSAIAYGGYSEVLRELGRFEESASAYVAAGKKFPHSPAFISGLANLRKLGGSLDEALVLYDRAIRTFPFDMASRVGRADVLKRLRKYDDALIAYDEILTVWPNYAAARNAKAAMFVLLNKLDQARNLVHSTNRPQTEDDWIAYHIRGMIVFKSGDLKGAIDHLNVGRSEAPFARVRRYFAHAIALVRIQASKYAEAEAVLKLTANAPNSSIANVLLFHAAVAQRKAEQTVLYRKLQVETIPLLIDIRERIASMHSLNAQTEREGKLLRDREIEAVLLEVA
jgi:tetratricopeptide (TPR) repeat protein